MPQNPLAQAMTTNPVIDALRAMSAGGFRHLPVVEDGRIWGIVSRGDFTGMEIEKLICGNAFADPGPARRDPFRSLIFP